MRATISSSALSSSSGRPSRSRSGTASATVREIPAGAAHHFDFPGGLDHAYPANQSADIHDPLSGEQLFPVKKEGGGRQHIQFHPQSIDGIGAAVVGQLPGQRFHARQGHDGPEGGLGFGPLHVAAHQQQRPSLGRNDQMRVLHRPGKVIHIRVLADDGGLDILPQEERLQRRDAVLDFGQRHE